ncbi:MAG: VOC family protein [Nocardioidaceae bacterium]
MTVHIRSITIDCERWEPLVDFWSAAGDFAEMPDNPNNPGDPEGLLVSADGAVRLLFIPVPEPKTLKNRVHLDVQPVDATRDDEVERLLALGASFVADHREPDGSGWVVLADPGGNEFCVERSQAERAS